MANNNNSTTGGRTNNRNGNNNAGGGCGGGRANTRKKNQDKPWKNKKTKNGFQGKLKDGTLKGIVITDGNNQPNQYKELIDSLPPYCAEKGYYGLDQIIKKKTDWVKDKVMTKMPDASLWSETITMEVGKDKAGNPIMRDKVVITDETLRDSKMKEWDSTHKYEQKRWEKCQEDKKSLITIICGQLDDGTLNELEISEGYDKAVEKGDLVAILKMLNKIAYGTNDGGMSFMPYKSTLALKSLLNFSNEKPSDPHTFKEELKTKFQATLAITNRFPNGTVYMEEMLRRHKDDDGNEKPLTIENYFAMDAEQQAFWENEGNKLNMSMLILFNSKNEPMKRELSVAYSQGSTDCYPLDPDVLEYDR